MKLTILAISSASRAMLLVPQLLPVELRAAMTRDHVGPSAWARAYGYATELYVSERPPTKMSVLVFWVEVRGLEGSKAEMLWAIVCNTPGCEFGKAMLSSFFSGCSVF